MRIKVDETVGLVIDVQDKLLPHMADNKGMIDNMTRLIRGLNELGLPLLITEQYRKGLGDTVKEVKDHIVDFHPMEKMSFSCCDDTAIQKNIDDSHRKNVIICGIEAHVCVLQTTIDLLEKGFRPVIIEDCTSSRKLSDKAIAVQRMRQEGAIISSYESVLFELARVSGTTTFKSISKLVK